MIPVRIGQPRFLRDTALAALAGAAIGLLFALVVGGSGFPEWGETLQGACSSLLIFYFVGLAMRLGLHAIHSHVHRGTDPATEPARDDLLRYTRPFLWLGAAGAAAAAVLALAFRLGT